MAPGQSLTLKRLFRLLNIVRSYGTAKRIGNIARGGISFMQRDIRIKSIPFVFLVNPTDLCDLQCPYC